MGRCGKQCVRGADLGHLAQVHHHHPVADVVHHAQVVADEDIGQAKLALQIGQQVQHLGFHRFVERRDGLVQNHHARLQGQRAGNIDALALAARELMRVALGKAGWRQAHPVHQMVGAGDRLFARYPMHLRAKGDRVLDRQARVERGIAVLEHHLHLAAKLLEAQVARAHRAAVKHQLAGGRVHQMHQQACSGRFAATGLAHHAQGLALEHLEIHAIDRAHQLALLEREMLSQTAHRQQRLGRATHIGGQRCGRG